MNILDEAITFAVCAHEGQQRKLAQAPYILHPLEVAAIIATMTDDLDVMAAGVLHDVVEDCGVAPSEILERFGERIAALVAGETEDKMRELTPQDSWQQRKESSLLELKNATDVNVKILWLADKLSNARSLYYAYKKKGDRIWDHFHQKDPTKQAWYYKTVGVYLAELSDTAAYQEYIDLLNKIFGAE